MASVDESVTIDTSDLDQYVGKSFGGGQLRDPVTVNDIRRWVQGMQYPNPLHYDVDYAARPLVRRDRRAAVVHGEHRHRPRLDAVGVRQDPRHRTWSSAATSGGSTDRASFPATRSRCTGATTTTGWPRRSFAGPDRVRARRQHAREPAGRGRLEATVDVGALPRRGSAPAQPLQPGVGRRAHVDVRAARRRSYERRLAWICSGPRRRPRRGGRTWNPGMTLPTCPIGPHTIQTFATEWRAFTSVVWGEHRRISGATSAVSTAAGSPR